jgi:hypothetical protein
VGSLKAKSHWKFAGFMNQILPAGFGGRLFVDANAVNKQKIYLNRWQLFVFPKLTNSYSLSFEFPYWFEDVIVNIVEYTGLYLDPMQAEILATENLVRRNSNQLLDIQADLEDLLER